jgi:hypothetical protein
MTKLLLVLGIARRTTPDLPFYSAYFGKLYKQARQHGSAQRREHNG